MPRKEVKKMYDLIKIFNEYGFCTNRYGDLLIGTIKHDGIEATIIINKISEYEYNVKSFEKSIDLILSEYRNSDCNDLSEFLFADTDVYYYRDVGKILYDYTSQYNI